METQFAQLNFYTFIVGFTDNLQLYRVWPDKMFL